MKNTEKNINKNSDKKNGNVNISDDVLITIVQTSAIEVEGVACVTKSIANDFIGRLSKKIPTKTIESVDKGERVSINIAINIKMGYKIMEVAERVQVKVKNALELMTGLDVDKVNVDVVSVQTVEDLV
ncbi:MAG: Asp23/Gls24 family envelope stress response protein [bacterium]